MITKRKIDSIEFLVSEDLPKVMIDVIELEKRQIRLIHRKGVTLKKISEVLTRTYSDVLKGKEITSSKITKIIGPVGKKKKTPKKTEKTPKK